MGGGVGGGGRGLGRTRARDLLIYRRVISFVCSTIEWTHADVGLSLYIAPSKSQGYTKGCFCYLVIGRLGGGKIVRELSERQSQGDAGMRDCRSVPDLGQRG